jgi:hypothetical protein
MPEIIDLSQEIFPGMPVCIMFVGSWASRITKT